MEVIKLGGVESEDAAFLAGLSREIRGRDLVRNPCVVVHGGGRRATHLSGALGLPTCFFEGLRVSSPEVVDVVDMVLCAVGGRVVRALVRGGVPALGLRGGDGLLLAKPHPRADVLERVGEVIDVDTVILRDVLATGRVPVVTPLALDAHGNLLNVNADTAAVAIALALGADKLVFLSGVPGVLSDNRLVESLTRAKSESLRAEGVLRDCMVPKVEAALRAHAGGVAEVRIKGLREQASEPGFLDSPSVAAASLFTEGTLIA